MNMIRLLMIIALGLIGMYQTSAIAAPRTVYQGTLQGAGEVVMEFDSHPADDGTVSGRYFYARYGVDIPLRGALADLQEPFARTDLPENQRAGLRNGDTDFDHPAATWHGVPDSSGYRGHWVAARTGMTRSFALRRVAEYDPDKVAPDSSQAITDIIAGGVGSGIAYDADINSKQAPYETLKLAGHAQPTGPEIGDGTVAYRIWRDPRTRLTYPRLSRHPDPAVMTRINHLLEQHHWQLNLAALGCVATRYTDDGPAAGTLGNFDEESVQVTWLSASLLTLTESGSIFCGGAHPNNHYDPYTFDLLRGEYLDWNRIINAYTQDKDGNRAPSTAIVRFIERIRATQSKGSAATDDNAEADCADVFPDYLAFVLHAPGKLSFAVSGIGHAMSVCLGPQIDIKLAALSPILKPGAAHYLVPSVKLQQRVRLDTR